MTEKEIAGYVVQWLKYQHWDVWQEIRFNRGSNIHDIVAVRNNLLWVIEVKQALSLTVMAQAYKSISHFKSIAVPKGNKRHYNKGANFAERVCKAYGIGVILVDPKYMKEYIKHKRENDTFHQYGYWEKMIVKQHLPPSLDRNGHRFMKSNIDQLKQMPKNFCKAGTNGGGYWTPYKQTVNEVKHFLEKHPGATIREIVDGLKEHHYASDKSAYANLGSALQSFEKEWCITKRTKKGFKYYIKKGKE